MKELKFGVIGAGGRGGLARAYGHDPENGCRLVAGCDVRPEVFPALKEKVGDDVFTCADYRDLLAIKEIDAVFITSPDNFHEEQAVASLEAGKDIYLEKPMAITLEGCDRILRTAYETGSKLYLGHNMRYMPVILKMKEIIDSGLIGEIQAGWCRHFISYGGDAYFKDWHSERRYANGLLLQKGAHDIDVMHWLMGGYTSRVVGMGMLSIYDKCAKRDPSVRGDASWHQSNWPPLEQTGFSPIIDVEDHNMIMMQLDNGAQASYTQCHYTPDSERNYTFIGTKGRVENMGDGGRCQVHVWTKRGSRHDPDIIHQLRPLEGSHGGADPLTVRGFIDFIRDGKAPNTSPVAARNSVATGVLGHLSMRSGCTPQDIPPIDPELEAYFANGQKR